jgi:hypothetical protein
MSARSRAASWAQKRTIANPGDADLAAGRFRCFADPLHQRLVARHDQRRADRYAAISDRRPRQLLADVTVEPDGFSKHQLPATAQAPAVDELAVQHLFAHRRAAEHHDFAEQKRSIFGQIDIDTPDNPCTVEQDGFLRQPGEMRSPLRLQRDIELRGGSGRAIDLFGRRRRQRQPRSLARRDIDIEAVAAGDAAGRVDEHARQAFCFGRGKAHAQRAGFMQIPAARDSILENHIEPHRALGAVGRECC